MKIILAVLFAAAALSARADDRIIPLTFTVKATEQIQNSGFLAADITNIPAPTVYSITTKTLLATLAQDEFFDGHYGSGAFPTGAKLLFVDDENDFSKGFFEVVDSVGLLIVRVDDELTLTEPDNVILTSGKENILTLANVGKVNQSVVIRLNFDNIGAQTPGTKFKAYLQGVMTATTTDSTPKSGAYVETIKSVMKAGGGSGTVVSVIDSQPSIITGSMTLSGSKSFSVQ